MLQAMLRRKLTRPEEGMEDLLTSNTFGLIKYMPEELVLLPFLSAAWSPLTKESLSTLLVDVVGIDSWRFWPYLRHPDCKPCEPDVELIFRHGDGSRTCLLIEAKYRSGKSSFASESDLPPNDQLAREFDNLSKTVQSDQITRYCVVYITADYQCPTADVEQSAAEFRGKRGYDPVIYWVSWRRLPMVLEAAWSQGSDMAADLLSLLLEMGLTTFCRLRFTHARRPEWQFQKSQTPWGWSLPSPLWRFEGVTSGEAPLASSESYGLAVWGLNPHFAWVLAHRPDQFYQWRTL